MYFSDVCYSGVEIHRWPLTLTFCITESNPVLQKGLDLIFACSFPDDTPFIYLMIIASLLSLGGSDWQMNCSEERKHVKYENILISSHRKRM